MKEKFERWRKDNGNDLTPSQFVSRAADWIREQNPEIKVNQRILHHALSQYYTSPHNRINENTVLHKILTNTPSIKAYAFRGEYGGGQLLDSRRGSLSFGSKSVAEHYAKNPNDRQEKVFRSVLIEADLTMFNPVVNDPEDPFVDGDVLINSLGPAKAKQIMDWAHVEGLLFDTDNFYSVCEEFDVEDYEELMNNGGKDALDALYVDAYPIFDRHEFVDWFLSAGFDGLAQGGNGVSALDKEYKVFSAEQVDIKQVHQLTPPQLEEKPEISSKQSQSLSV